MTKNVRLAEGLLPECPDGDWQQRPYVVEFVPDFKHHVVTVNDLDFGRDEYGDLIDFPLTAAEVFALADRLRELGVTA